MTHPVIDTLSRLDADRIAALIRRLPPREAIGVTRLFRVWAHEAQRPPEGDWASWIIMAGRGFGKTRAGAEWVTRCARDNGDLRIALVAATLDDARAVMIEGESGLLAVAGGEIAAWRPTRQLLRFKSGAQARLFSGASPQRLRGPQHHIAWCDELAKWRHPRETWDMLQLGLRLGERPRALITTTPATAAGELLEAIMALPDTIVTGGATRDNIHLSSAFVEGVYGLYKGTRLEKQELEGELLPDARYALWSAEMIERSRLRPLPGASRLSLPPEGEGYSSLSLRGEGYAREASEGEGTPGYTRLVIGVDPPVEDGTCGIIACGLVEQRSGHLERSREAHVIADHSVTGRSPEGWARAVADAVRAHETATGLAVKVIAERNQGGRMVEANLRAADANLRVKLVTASKGKVARAEPIAHLFEAGRIKLAGHFPELEAELRQFKTDPALKYRRWYGADGRAASPDRADAMVWALTELMLTPSKPEPRVRAL